MDPTAQQVDADRRRSAWVIAALVALSLVAGVFVAAQVSAQNDRDRRACEVTVERLGGDGDYC